jgi:hypothetical protein
LSDVLNDFICSKFVDIISHDEFKANFFVVFNQLRTLYIQSASARANLRHEEDPDLQFVPNPCMNTGVGHKSLLKCQREEGAVRDLGLLGNASQARPGINVCIEMDDRYGSINLMKRSKDRKHLDVTDCETRGM